MDAIFRDPNCNGFWLRRYAYILILMQTAARARKGQTRFVPVKTLGTIKKNLLRFTNDIHAAGVGHGQG